MDNTAKRNFILFTLLLVSCSSVLIFSVVKGDKSLAKTDDLVIETQEVITQSERLSFLIEGMLSAQRGYLITGNEEFVEEYENKKAEVVGRCRRRGTPLRIALKLGMGAFRLSFKHPPWENARQSKKQRRTTAISA